MTKSLNLPVNNVDSKAPETEGIEGLERRVNACCQRSRKLFIQVLAMLALIAICIAAMAGVPFLLLLPMIVPATAMLVLANYFAHASNAFERRFKLRYGESRSLALEAVREPTDAKVESATGFLRQSLRQAERRIRILARLRAGAGITVILLASMLIIDRHRDERVEEPFIGPVPTHLAEYRPILNDQQCTAVVLTNLIAEVVPVAVQAEKALDAFVKNAPDQLNSITGAAQLQDNKAIQKAIDAFEKDANDADTALRRIEKGPFPSERRADAASARQRLEDFRAKVRTASEDPKAVQQSRQDIKSLLLKVESVARDVKSVLQSVQTLTESITSGASVAKGVSPATARQLATSVTKAQDGVSLSKEERANLREALASDFGQQPPTFLPSSSGKVAPNALAQLKDEVQTALDRIRDAEDEIIETQLSGSTKWNFPFHYQGASDWCGPTAVRMVLHYKYPDKGDPKSKPPGDPDPNMKTLPGILWNGLFTKPGGVQDGFRMYKIGSEQHKAKRMSDVCRHIEEGRPPILLVRMDNSELNYHWVVAIAWADGKIGLADPAMDGQTSPVWIDWGDLAGSMNFTTSYEKPHRPLNRGVSGFVLRPLRGTMVVVGDPVDDPSGLDDFLNALLYLPKLLLDILSYLFNLAFGSGVDGGATHGGSGNAPGTQGSSNGQGSGNSSGGQGNSSSGQGKGQGSGNSSSGGQGSSSSGQGNGQGAGNPSGGQGKGQGSGHSSKGHGSGQGQGNSSNSSGGPGSGQPNSTPQGRAKPGAGGQPKPSGIQNAQQALEAATANAPRSVQPSFEEAQQSLEQANRHLQQKDPRAAREALQQAQRQLNDVHKALKEVEATDRPAPQSSRRDPIEQLREIPVEPHQEGTKATQKAPEGPLPLPGPQ